MADTQSPLDGIHDLIENLYAAARRIQDLERLIGDAVHHYDAMHSKVVLVRGADLAASLALQETLAEMRATVSRG